MILFPAIDIKDGKCVRLCQGEPSKATVYGEDPVAMARHWTDLGATWLHVIDLDGAFDKTPRHMELIGRMIQEVSIPVQVGGGIRTLDHIRTYLDMGVQRVILGTVALENPELLEQACLENPQRIALAIDARDGKVAIKGWQETTKQDVISMARSLAPLPLATIIYTDIGRDGMQSGVNVDATRRLLESVSLPVVASGGVASIEDLERLFPLVPLGLEGVITGRALYAGTLDLHGAMKRIRTMRASHPRRGKG